MNWTTFQTHNMAADKAFEVMCNQLFENWCKEQYTTTLSHFFVVNGAGGDGGVESYAVLNDDKVIGLQAKWFPSSITSGQIGQIRNSIKTAIKIRSKISKYIVCVPRDLASKTGRSDEAEDTRWDNFIKEMAKDYPDVDIELWNETRILTELQKPNSAGIYRFWFGNSELTETNIQYAFDKAKNSWLITKYVPELNAFGHIEKTVSRYLGDYSQRENLLASFCKISELCEKYQIAVNDLIAICTDQDAELKEIIADTSRQLDVIFRMSSKVRDWLETDVAFEDEIDSTVFNIKFSSIIEQIHRSQAMFRHHFHSYEVTKYLDKLSKFNFYELFREVDECRHQKCLLILGDPGTGKTHGISAFAEKLISEKLHTPLVIRARGIPVTYTWKDIITENLGLASVWSEEELWQALTSMVNRHKFTDDYLGRKIKIEPKIAIIIDGLDESAPQDRWVDRIRETDVITSRYPQIRFCFTARPAAMPKPINYSKTVRINSRGDVSAHKLFDAYIKAYNITAQNAGWLKAALTTPLALKLFCELNKNSTVNYSERAEVSIAALWKQKIQKIENECCDKTGNSLRNQYVLRAILTLSDIYLSKKTLERSDLMDELKNALNVSDDKAETLVSFLETYGVLSCYCEAGTGIEPDKYLYYPGIQGYFDFASASAILSKYQTPDKIDFNNYQAIQTNTMNALAVLSIQNHDFLITRNQTVRCVLDEYDIAETQFFALQHTNHNNANQFVDRSLEIMAESADALITIVNNLVLPLSRDCGHPLGVTLLDSFLNSFQYPAQRDILWSIPGYLKDGLGKRWCQSQEFDLDKDEYSLTSEDLCDGCPTIYAWALSSVNNTLRKVYRDRLMVWARNAPKEFYKLFLKFSNVNDPQIKNDLFSILMCLVHDVSSQDLTRTASNWVMDNILAPDKIESNRNIAIRYYSIAILKKAVFDGIFTEDEVRKYLPPYHSETIDIPLNKDALSGTRMGGYKAIDYDLSRYVLIDPFTSKFSSYRRKTDGQFEKLINEIVTENPEYAGMNTDQFILSMAYAYVLQTGWNEKEFYNLNKDETGENVIGGPDISIIRTYSPATHGSMSSVMSVCEKYVWQARNEIAGFLCDRLLFGDNAIELTDYGMIDDFIIPAHDIAQINPDDIPEDRPWYIPETEVAILDSETKSKSDVVDSVLNAPYINWEKWIFVNNRNADYNIASDELIALNMFSSFYGVAGVETDLFVNSIIVDKEKLPDFIKAIPEAGRNSAQIANPTDWYGGIEASCYITPKEICCFPWKTRYESYNTEEFADFDINCAVDKCCYNSLEYGDVYYYLPSATIRNMLGIVDTDGYLYTSSNGEIIGEYTMAGEKWRTYQDYLMVNKRQLLDKLSQNGKTLVWIMEERRSESGISREKYGEFGVERLKCFVGYFEEDGFKVEEIRSEESQYIPK